MFCPKCGASCGDNERFCPSCGAPLEQQAAPAASSSASTAAPAGTGKAGLKLSPKMIGIAAVAVVAILVIVLLVNLIGGLFSGGGSAGSYSANAIQFLRIDDEYVVYAGTKKLDTVDTATSRFYSIDASVAAFMDGDMLYVATSKGVDKVDEDVAAYDLSSNGAVIAYINDEYEVYYYNVSKGGKPTKIGEGEDGVLLGGIAPDGSAIVFTTNDGGDLEGFLSKNGKEAESLGDDILTLAVSNGGNYIYYIESKDGSGSGKFYVRNGKNDTPLEKEFSRNTAGGMILNSDGSQLIYYSDGNTYLSVKGGESDKVSSGILIPFGPSYSPVAQTSNGVICYSYSDLRGHCYINVSNGDMYYVDSKGESTKVVSGASDYALSANGKSMIYLKDGDLVKVEDVSKGKNSKTVELTDEGKISSFAATPDLGAVYYMLKDDLYYQKGTGKAVSVGDDVDYYFMAADFSVCYIVSDDELYTSSGKEMSNTNVKDLDDVYFSYTGFYKGVCFFAQSAGGGEYDLYVASGNKPKEFEKDISSVLD